MNIRDVPDPQALGFKAAKWQRALEEHHRLQRQRTDALAANAELRKALASAQDEDTWAHAAAIRAGKPDPGTPATDGVKSEQAAVQRQVDALAVAVDQSERELAAAIASEAPALLAELDRAEQERRADMVAAVDAYAEARTRHSESIALREYLQGFPDGRYKMGGARLRVARSGDGSPPPLFSNVLAMLHEDTVPQERPEPTGTPLRPREQAFGVTGTALRD